MYLVQFFSKQKCDVPDLCYSFGMWGLIDWKPERYHNEFHTKIGIYEK